MLLEISASEEHSCIPECII